MPPIRHATSPERLSGEGREHFHDQAKGRDDEDVDLRVTEEPEEVLPQVWGATARGDEERRLIRAVEHLHEDSGDQSRRCERAEERRHQHRPHEHRHPAQGHPRSPLGEDGRDHVQTRQCDREADQREAHEVGVHAEHVLVGEWRIARPPRGEATEEDRGEQDQAGRRQEPERERFEARERHVARADHDRHEVVAERTDDRRRRHEDHQRAVQVQPA